MLILIAISFIVVGGISSTRLNKNSIAYINGNEISAVNVASIYKRKINELRLNNYSTSELKQLGIVEQ
ncbi:SurA N-terminal domain-containing protein, partial [Alphaproteobacteria bacterium]|nr:SurA N-terminal domain-containing protein [Alphaproteobacteria bacterium]